MKKFTILATLINLSLAPSVAAQTLVGKVTSADGAPIAKAKIELEGTDIQVFTNESGEFEIIDMRQGIIELHISAAGYSHLHEDVTLTQSQSSRLTFTLSRSPIDVIDVVASPIHLSSMESAIPVKVLGGDALRRQTAATLGDTLENVPGVHTNFHAKVASTPIIRGLSGPRVLIAQNGLDVSDVSRVGPDHAVTSEASTAEQIEVLRGPATLFYGSGAIGGVVNIVDKRIPKDNELSGDWLLQHSSVDDQNLGSFNLTTGTGNLAFYADGFFRKSNDYDIPVTAVSEHEHEEKEHKEEEHEETFSVANSSEDSSGFTLGTSYLMSNGFVGIAVEQFDREYGIPGHSHGYEGHHEEHEEGDHGEKEHSEEEVFADLEQTKIHLVSELNLKDALFNSINFRAGYTDYKHSEIEDGSAGTTFKNETYELRLDSLHKTVAHFNGGVSFHYKLSEVEAQGSEAFTPASETEMFALSIMEERHFGDVLLQLGARVERVSITANEVVLPVTDVHSHDVERGDEHEDEHGGEGEAQVFAEDRSYTPISLSAGFVWDVKQGYNLGVAVSRAQRAPSASELFSFGPHIGTRTYEVGALFALEDHEGHAEFGLSGASIDMETSNNIDLTLRKTQGDVGFIFNLFYNQVDNYYYQIDTGLFAEAGHDHGDEEHEEEHEDEHGEEEHGHDEHSDELPIFLFQTNDVVLNGFEAQVAWQINDNFNASVFSDFVRARLKDGENLPRTPPLRFGTHLSYENESLSAHLEITRYQSQNRIAQFETTTDGYTLVDVHVSYDLPIFNQSMAVYFRGENLTDQQARVHTSFIKDDAPRPGRNLAVGIKGYF